MRRDGQLLLLGGMGAAGLFWVWRRRSRRDRPITPPEMRAATMRFGSLFGAVPVKSRCLSPMHVAAYLDRLGLAADAVEEPTLETLTLLQEAHVDRVAYENLDLYTEDGGPAPLPPLDPCTSVERVALRCRGGYCFLLVDSFAALLLSLGFQVSMHTSGVGDDPLAEERWGNHVVLLVHFPDGRRFVADVGLGDGPSRPFELKPHVWQENGYRFQLADCGSGRWRFTHDALGSFSVFDFDADSSVAGCHEFAAYHKYYWTHPRSVYRTCGLVVQRVSPTHGMLRLRDCTLTRIHPSLPGGSAVLATAADAAHLFELLHEHFSLSLAGLSEAQRASLWRVAEARHKAWCAEQAVARAAGRHAIALKTLLGGACSCVKAVLSLALARFVSRGLATPAVGDGCEQPSQSQPCATGTWLGHSSEGA